MGMWALMAAWSLLLPSGGAEAAPVYDQWFTGDALRVDYVHVGTAREEDLALECVRFESPWAGNPGLLLDPVDTGAYRVVVRDATSGRVLYTRGYSTLFGEWQTTDEARAGVRRAFPETVRVPWPKAPVVVAIEGRARDNARRPLGEFPVDPNAHTVVRERRFPGARVVTLQETGAPGERVDLLFVGDGYTAEQADKLVADARRFMGELFAWEPFASRRDAFNVRVVVVPSAERGVDEPRKGVYRDTVLGFTFNTFDTARYLNAVDGRALHDVAAHAPWDALIVISNTSRYGGAGIYNFYSVIVADNEYDDYVALHEFGHGFAGLGDEYYSSAVAYSEFYPAGVEPWEPNLTALLDPARVKWATRLTQGVPVPTPDRPEYAGVVGVFEGAGYSAKGLYRPAQDCRMFSKAAVDFCPVCRAAIEERIDTYVRPGAGSDPPGGAKRPAKPGRGMP